MAKIKIAGNTIVVESAYSLADIKKVERYDPTALTLADQKGGVKFKVGTSAPGCGSVGTYGVTFGDESKTGSGRAIVNVEVPADVENVVEYAVDKIGQAVAGLNEVESNVSASLGRIDADIETIRSNIEVIA